MTPDKRDPKGASRTGIVVVRDDPWVLLYLPALDRLVWIDLREASFPARLPEGEPGFPSQLPESEPGRSQRGPESPLREPERPA